MRCLYLAVGTVIIIAGLRLAYNPSADIEARLAENKIGITHAQLQSIKQFLKTYRNSNGSYPKMNEGLLAVKPLVDACGRGPGPLRRARADSSGIITPFGEPFIYENRSGFDPTKFSDSGANFDRRGVYSVKVDNNIFVWSVGSKKAFESAANWKRIRAAVVILTIILAASLLTFYTRFALKSLKPEPSSTINLRRTASLIIIDSAVILVVTLASMPFVEREYPLMQNPDAELSQTIRARRDYVDIIAAYRDRKILDDATYNRMISTLISNEKRIAD